MRAGDARLAFGEPKGTKSTAEALDWTVTINEIVTVPDNRAFGAWRVNPEIEAGIASEERCKPGNECLKRTEFKRWTLVTAGVAFTARRVQNVKNKERRRKALYELEQYGGISARDTGDQSFRLRRRDLGGENWSERMRYPFFRRLPI